MIASIRHSILKNAFSASTRMEFDKEYPGTAVERLNNVHKRVKTLTPAQLNGDWSTVRRNLLWAGTIKRHTRIAYSRLSAATMTDSLMTNEYRHTSGDSFHPNQLPHHQM